MKRRLTKQQTEFLRDVLEKVERAETLVREESPSVHPEVAPTLDQAGKDLARLIVGNGFIKGYKQY